MTGMFVRWFATAVLAALGVFLIFYAWLAFGQLYPFSFGDRSLWEDHWMVRGDVTIPMWLRIAYFAVWSVSIVATCVMLGICMYLLTKHNAVNAYPIVWAYDPSGYKMIALAVVLFMFGWVMRDAIEIEQTNKEFV